MRNEIRNRIKRQLFLCSLAILFLALLGLTQISTFEAHGQNISAEEYQDLSLNLSEPSGFFGTDNLVSNETSFLHVTSLIQENTRPGQAYIGVGPDQNFTYIAKARPSIAFIIDIRRDNLLHHSYYKAIFAASADRWDYLSLLFGKPIPADAKRSSAATAADLVRHFESFPSSPEFFEKNFETLWTGMGSGYPRLIREVDRAKVYAIAAAFFTDGIDIRYEIPGRRMFTFFPTFAELMVETDLKDRMGHYLNSEEDFKFLKKLEEENRIIPLVGNFGGPSALKGIGDEIRKRGLRVSVFYLSNVEFYLFRNGLFRNFVDSVRNLPVDDSSLFIRSYFNNWFGTWRTHPFAVPNYFSTSLAQSIKRFLELDRASPYHHYWDLVTRDYLGAPARPETVL